jgi:2-polyprenyl-3-methyl-5-hydroxy-6-metoxy-1,4-benzoquinol methylase
MNRKQRRAMGRRGAQPRNRSVASATSTETLAQLCRVAAAYHGGGAFIEAERHYRHILTLFPNHAETHRGLGAALMAQGKANDAIPHFGHVIALNPTEHAGYEDLGKACLGAGQLKLAIGAASRAVELNETAETKTLFGQCVRDARFTADDGRIRKLILRALSEAWDRPRNLAGACISLVKLDGFVNECIMQANSAWPARLPVAQLRGSLVAALSRDQILCCLLESDTINDVGLERLLTNVRGAMLTTGTAGDAIDEGLLGFYCTMARQCFINQYVFSMTEVEADQARRLRVSLEKALGAGDLCPAHWPAIVGAYIPLHTLSHHEALLDRSWPASVRALLDQQIEKPAEERRIASTIPVLTSIDGDVSRAVRQQYEESPYPCWVKAGLPGQPIVLSDRPQEQGLDVLIAGCGTGLSTIEFARQTPRARILAIDLSVASLCYAQRMAESYGLSNVEFGQADIMTMAASGRAFDYVDSSGVLHHLADPWEGWRLLLALLRPGGIMQVGLYSELARKSVVAARALIAERGYKPIAEDIRRCREEVMAADDGSLLKSVIKWNDFFATNECRDLLFHVQEQRVTLREIKSFLAANGVRFAGFRLEAATFQRFVMRFPQQSAMMDLDCWEAFEIQAPDTFSAMYQFWVRKLVNSDGSGSES